MRKLSYIAIGISLFFSSCVKEKFDSSKLAGSINLTPGIAVPIGYAHMTLQKYFNDSSANKGVIIDANGFITLVYREKVFSLPALDFFKFPDVSGSISLNQPFPPKKRKAFNAGPISDTAFFQMIPQASGVQIDSMNLNSGMLTLKINNTWPVQGNYSISFPGILKNGKAVQISAITFQQSAAVISLDLSNDKIVLVNHNGQDNFLTAIFAINLNLAVDTFSSGSQLLGLDFNFHNIQYSIFYGYAGKGAIPINNGSFHLGFYQRLIDGNFIFSNPRMKLLLSNSIGVPLDIYFSDIHAITKNGNMPPIAGSGVPGSANPKTINYPLKPFGTAKDSIFLDSTNSNLPAVLAAVPTQMFFSFEDSINPGSSLQKGFVTDSSKLEADLQIELPLQGHGDLLIEDTLNFEFASFVYKNPKEVSLLYFRLNVTNGFPVEIRPQIYFTDNQFHPLDSLITDSTLVPNLLIKAAGVDGNGIVNQKISNTINVKFTGSRILNIEKATHIITRGRIKSRNYPANVKFLNTYALDFYLGVIVQLQVNTNL